ncbi:trypsin-like cysteine/serine peptidase domain-containing protein [Lophiotrema nucula]|uniref:Trypsin-like cysteine/serine peptidase domain-containing protein n=1 Tax=Lophiotrema nucula TaxID=690887 RepID=A0A6A5ZC98_9PLEO|nr:trypsin-like cysteine/serine peptidase domain-containing protein [Lophiotrema nucula]
MAFRGKRRQDDVDIERPTLPSRRSARQKKVQDHGTVVAPIVIDSSPVATYETQAEDEEVENTTMAVVGNALKRKEPPCKTSTNAQGSKAKGKQKAKASSDEDEDDEERDAARTSQSRLLYSKNKPTWLGKTLPAKLDGLTDEGVKLLHRKQKKLKSPNSQVHYLHDFCDRGTPAYQSFQNAVNATLVFAQEEAGTAICISPTGLLLTCSHCVAESQDALDLSRSWWLLFSSGRIVQAQTVKWDPVRDLALLRIVAAQEPVGSVTYDFDVSSKPTPSFPYVDVAEEMVNAKNDLLCVGHPGSEDLEASVPGRKTGYDVLHISEGKFRGYAEGQDVHDNSEIGALMHDCWTYWGHSGAPLIRRGRKTKKVGENEEGVGELVGLHSSWDDETGMRRGVGLDAIRAFLEGVKGFEGGRWKKVRR